MVKSIFGIVVGVLILVAGIFNLVKDKNDADSKKIYGVITAIGAVIAVVSVVILILSLRA